MTAKKCPYKFSSMFGIGTQKALVISERILFFALTVIPTKGKLIHNSLNFPEVDETLIVYWSVGPLEEGDIEASVKVHSFS